ncbi:DUF2190 family protein [Hyphomonas sp. ND6WE1B]|uniref:DUF2190 family protein n=1 Tax=Hyphomonas sp. ND6WE1B TaxID=1848191 RepID=UPI00080769AA|nr:capsid cement protein [Hyphomonas sp. ND6WE1B]
MKNYIQPGRTLTIPAPANVSSGGIVVAGDIIGIAAGDALITEPVDIACEGVFTLSKVSADVLTLGAPVYTNGADVGLEDSTHTTKIGTCVVAAGNGATEVAVRLSGF